MNKQFDLIAIGTGSAASSVASRCRAAGWQVAVIDSRPFGGTCALRGCDPKKVLVWRRRGRRLGPSHAGQGNTGQRTENRLGRADAFQALFHRAGPKTSGRGLPQGWHCSVPRSRPFHWSQIHPGWRRHTGGAPHRRRRWAEAGRSEDTRR